MCVLDGCAEGADEMASGGGGEQEGGDSVFELGAGRLSAGRKLNELLEYQHLICFISSFSYPNSSVLVFIRDGQLV